MANQENNVMKARVWSEKHQRHFYHGDVLFNGRVEICMYGDGTWIAYCVSMADASDRTVIPGDLEYAIGCDDKNRKPIYVGDVVYVPEGCSGDNWYAEHFVEIKMEDGEYWPIAFTTTGLDDVGLTSCTVVRTKHDPESEKEKEVAQRQREIAAARKKRQDDADRKVYETLKKRFE